MIDRLELLSRASSMQVSITDVERDYVFGWLLHGLYSELPPSIPLVLKGGNAIRKGHLPSGRYSDDLDFSFPNALDGEALLDTFNTACRAAQAVADIKFDLSRNRVVSYRPIEEGKNVYKLLLYFTDFAGQTGHLAISIRVDVTEFDRLQLEPVSRSLIHQYSDAAECSTPIQVITLEEIVADKLRCLLQRRHANDLFDLVYGAFVAEDLRIDRGQVVRAFLGKTIFGANPLAAMQLILAASWDATRQYWSKVAAPLISKIAFDDAVSSLKSGLHGLFDGLRGDPQTHGAYFIEPVRSQLLHAAKESRLLNIWYQGYQRTVEPYSISWKRKVDGNAREYLYVYDRTGGRTGPGLKSLVADQVQRVDLLEEKFTSRLGDGILADILTSGSFGRGYTTANRYARSTRHTIQCSYCNRRFAHSTSTTTLRKHKDGYGNTCPGRRGYRV